MSIPLPRPRDDSALGKRNQVLAELTAACADSSIDRLESAIQAAELFGMRKEVHAASEKRALVMRRRADELVELIEKQEHSVHSPTQRWSMEGARRSLSDARKSLDQSVQQRRSMDRRRSSADHGLEPRRRSSMASQGARRDSLGWGKDTDNWFDSDEESDDEMRPRWSGYVDLTNGPAPEDRSGWRVSTLAPQPRQRHIAEPQSKERRERKKERDHMKQQMKIVQAEARRFRQEHKGATGRIVVRAHKTFQYSKSELLLIRDGKGDLVSTKGCTYEEALEKQVPEGFQWCRELSSCMAMGFDVQASCNALTITHGSLEAAISIITDPDYSPNSAAADQTEGGGVRPAPAPALAPMGVTGASKVKPPRAKEPPVDFVLPKPRDLPPKSHAPETTPVVEKKEVEEISLVAGASESVSEGKTEMGKRKRKKGNKGEKAKEVGKFLNLPVDITQLLFMLVLMIAVAVVVQLQL